MSFEEEIDYLDVTFGSGYLYSGNVRVFVHKQDTTPLVTLVTPKGIGWSTANLTTVQNAVKITPRNRKL